MIDPLEAVLIDAAADTGIASQVGTQLASQHHYGGETGDWPLPSKGLTINYDGGIPDIYYPRRVIRLQVRCYAETMALAGQVANAVFDWLRAWLYDRRTVNTSTGLALIYYVMPISEPSSFVDPEINYPVVLFFLEASVGEKPIGD